MIDLETCDTVATSTILTIGAQGFTPNTGKHTDVTYYRRLTTESQEERTISNDTLAWWGKQSAEAQEEAFGGDDRLPIKEALEELSKLTFKHSQIWTNGTLFDIVILENAFRQYEVPIPWNFWQIMDAKTLFKLAPKVGKLKNNHHALLDCHNQIDLVYKSYKILGIADI